MKVVKLQRKESPNARSSSLADPDDQRVFYNFYLPEADEESTVDTENICYVKESENEHPHLEGYTTQNQKLMMK